MIEQPSITVTIQNRDNVLFSGALASVTAENSTGTFDILPQHANLISLIEGKLGLIHVDGTKEEIPAIKGVLRVKNDIVKILIEK